MLTAIGPSVGRGCIAAPPSKSAAHRLLLCAGLARGKSVIRNVADSQDVSATVDCLRALGAAVALHDDAAEVIGIDPFALASTTLPCRESGSTLRFFVPVALLGKQPVTLTGSERLFKRPLSVYEKICAEQGLSFQVKPQAVTVCGPLSPGSFTVAGDVSSQFISGLAMVLPLLHGDNEIRILPPFESRPYVDMTLRAMAEFGVTAAFSDALRIEIPGNRHYGERCAAVEGDYSNAAFFAALNLLGGSVTVTGLDPESPQGDRIYQSYFAQLQQGTPTLDLTDCPDLGPICMAMAAALHGAVFTGVRRLRLKESDRCAAMAAELSKFGVCCTVGADQMTIRGGDLRRPKERLYCHNDHRVVMALAVLATVTGAVLEGTPAVAKSLPDFFERLQTLGIEVTQDGMDQ